MRLNFFKHIIIKGDAYNRGYMYGDKVKNLIQQNISYYFNFWLKRFGLSRESILNKAEKMKNAIESFDPSLLEEMKGIADGASVSLTELIALNARYEFMWIMMSKTCCTSILTLPEITQNNHTLIGQNWDYKPSVLNRNILLQIKRKEAPDLLTHVEAGCLARIGLNSKGLGLCVNALVSSHDKFEPKVPFHILCRSILDCPTISEAIGRVVNSDRAVSYNFLIACSRGVGIDLELLPTDFNYIMPEKGLIVHTNHFLKTNGFSDKFVKIIPDTLVRYQRAKNILRSFREINIEALMKIFRDHFNYPNSICRHGDPKLKVEDQIETLTSIIMDLEDLKMFITKGPPCKSSYFELRLTS